ncbi:MAG: hypothetical protein KIT84_24020 [Labilithrix sp.]|nr:hypothetical protein [Labilithrix sp.]MCW5814117.1 hypothetical protein [Labilithrix sp.]
MNRRRIGSLVFLAVGLAIAFFLANDAPQEQHVRVVLGSGAPEVTGVTLSYLGAGGDVADETHFTYAPGKAPRVVAHEPKLPHGDYQLRVDVAATPPDASTEIHRSVERQVTLKGGSAQVDVSSAIVHD